MPNIDALIDTLDNKKYTAVMVYSNDVFLWTLMQGALFLNEKYPEGAQELINFNSYINEKLAYTRGCDDEKSYRQIAAIFHSANDTQKITQKITTTPLTDDQKQEIIERQQRYYLQLVKELAATIDRQNGDIVALRQEKELSNNELSAIKGSKTWRLARKLSKLKNTGRR